MDLVGCWCCHHVCISVYLSSTSTSQTWSDYALPWRLCQWQQWQQWQVAAAGCPSLSSIPVVESWGHLPCQCRGTQHLTELKLPRGTQPISAPNLRELCQVLMLHFEKPPEQNVEHSGFFQTFLLVLSAAPQNTPIYPSDSDIDFVYTQIYKYIYINIYIYI